jgi:hypothetical protein
MFFSVSFCFSQEVKNFEEFEETMSLASEVWYNMLFLDGPEKEKRYQQVLCYDMAKKVDKLRACPQYYNNGAVSTVIAKFDSAKSFCLLDMVNYYQKNLTLSNVMEHLEMFGSTTGRYSYVSYECKYLILPLTVESKYELKEGIEILVQWVRSPMPHIDTGFTYRPLELIFEQLGLFDKAWRIQLEMGQNYYYGYFNPRSTGKYNSYYLCAANNAYRAGNKKLGWSFLMNAAVFEYKDDAFKQAMEMAKVWIDVESGKRELPEQKILAGEERKKAFLEIVKRYQKMNAHPRAWLFIQENKKEFDDADALIKKVQDDWLYVTQIIMRGFQKRLKKLITELLQNGISHYKSKELKHQKTPNFIVLSYHILFFKN